MQHKILIALVVLQAIALSILGTWIMAMRENHDLLLEGKAMSQETQRWIARYAQDQFLVSSACFDSMAGLMRGLDLHGGPIDKFLTAYDSQRKAVNGVGGE